MEQQFQYGNATGSGDENTLIISRVPVEIPQNLCDWVEPHVLSTWIEEALQKWMISSNTPPATSHDHDVLSLVLAGLCEGRCSCHEIDRGSQTDIWLRSACTAGGVPRAPYLRSFCRNHATLLKLLLYQLIAHAVDQRASFNGRLPPGLESTLGKEADGRVKTFLEFDDDLADED